MLPCHSFLFFFSSYSNLFYNGVTSPFPFHFFYILVVFIIVFLRAANHSPSRFFSLKVFLFFSLPLLFLFSFLNSHAPPPCRSRPRRQGGRILWVSVSSASGRARGACVSLLCPSGARDGLVKGKALSLKGCASVVSAASVSRRLSGCGRLVGRGRLRCCLLYTSPSPRDKRQSRMPSSA